MIFLQDIRDRWPEFSKHLDSHSDSVGDNKPVSKFNPMVAEQDSSKPSTSGGGSDSVSDIMASLAARGICVQKK